MIIKNVYDRKLLTFLFGNVSVFSIRFIYFIFLSFLLEISDLGLFATLISIASLVLCFVSFGNYNLLMKRKSKGEDSFDVLSEYFLNSFVFLLCLMLLLVLIDDLGFSFFFNDFDIYILFKIIIAEFIFTSIPGLFKSASLSDYDGKIKKDAITNVVTSLLLLSSVILMYTVMSNNVLPLSSWSNIYLFIAIITISIRIFIWRDVIRIPRINLIKVSIIKQIKGGSYFMIASLMRTSFLHIDKILIVSFLGLKMAGYYAIAFRFFNVMLMITNSVSGVKEAKLYQLAVSNISSFSDEVRLINKKSMMFFMYTIPIWLVLLVFIYYVYSLDSVYIFVALFFICPLQLISFTMLNALNSLSYEKERILILLLSFLLNISIVVFFNNSIGWLSVILGLALSSSVVISISKIIINRSVK
ncbi:oligosaccharide flippase family protein [Citrobacter braakii]|uniref:oligosaccharide flippase family protein n=1 Tax=Citrobacter braakii TaxID=57706 RepID=UPI00253FF05C|nr:oligosaccharide flippase family protein [Citrobacter braakii]WIF77269.1 oligosaccharide flippase family protein [Citrobacter braakii]